MPFALPSGNTSAYSESSIVVGYEGCQLTDPRRLDASGDAVVARVKFVGERGEITRSKPFEVGVVGSMMPLDRTESSFGCPDRWKNVAGEVSRKRDGSSR